MSWYNDDGLYIRFGTEKSVVAFGGESSTDGNMRVITLDLDWTDFAAFSVTKIISEGVTLPDGAWLDSAVFTVTTVFTSGGSATVGFGTIDTDRTTAHDVDGIDVAIPKANIDAIGDVITCDGALIGTTLVNSTPMYITATVGTANLTAGAGQLVIRYRMPL